MREVDEGVCTNHLDGKSLAFKILRQEYYWPIMHQDAIEFVQKYDHCRRNAIIQRQPASHLSQLLSVGIDILGLFPQATGQCKFLLATINYFTKWVEAESLACITEARVKDYGNLSSANIVFLGQ